MYAKLAWRNIGRSIRDYAIYFLTLVFAVAIFYVFNSVSDQPAILSLRESTRRMAQGFLATLEWLTVIMTGVVAFLVLYANRVIVRKRSRELGTYLLLGMEQGRLAVLLLAETALIGMAALLVGLMAGIFLSQLFALVVARVLRAELTGYPFVFSSWAALRTLLCYGLAFLAVGLWQAAAIYRQRLIDLIKGGRRNETIRLRSRSLSAAVVLLGALVLGAAYWLADRVSRDPWVSPRDVRIWIGAALGVVATYLLFWGAAGVLVGVQGRQRGWLARGLNRFLYRQVTAKINTHAGMLATIALMLTITICAMSFGLGLGRALADEAERVAPFDYSFLIAGASSDFEPVLRVLDQYGVKNRQAVRFQTSVAWNLTGKDLMLPEDASRFEAAGGMAEYVVRSRARVLPFSAYQALRALKGYPAVEVPAERFLMHYSGEGNEYGRQVRQAFGRFLAQGSSIEVAGQALRPASTRVMTEPLGDFLEESVPLLVVPDAVAAALPVERSYMVVEVEGEPSEELESAISHAFFADPEPEGDWRDLRIRDLRVSQAYVLEGILLFLTSYLGVMFILISATLLALQQVTDAVEHRQRFEVLRKLGADDPMIDGAIARQLGLYFLTPVAVALIHATVAMIALDRLFSTAAGYRTVWPATLATLGIFALIYGAYYLLSFQSCRALFRESQPL